MRKSRSWQTASAVLLTLALLAGCGANDTPAVTTAPEASAPAVTASESASVPGSTQADPVPGSEALPPESTVTPSSSEVPPASSEVPPASSEVPPETSVPPVTETPLNEDIVENPDGSKLIRRYDPEGRLIEEIRTAPGGAPLSSKKLVYYPGGNTVKWIFEEIRKENGAFVSSAETGYYENGQIKSSEERAADGSSRLIQYDENGRETLQEKKNKDGVTVSSVEQTYHENGSCASRISEKRTDQGALKERTGEIFYENGVAASVEKILSDGRRQLTEYGENGIRTLYEEYDGSAVLRLRNRWEYYEDGKISRTVEEAWKQDGSLKSRIDTKYSVYDAIWDRRTIPEAQPDREIYESFDDSNRLLYREETLLDGTFVSSFETSYYFRSDQPEMTEEIWMENGARRSLRRSYAQDGTLTEIFELRADGSTSTTALLPSGDPIERVYQDADGKLTEKLSWAYYESGEKQWQESYFWNEEVQGYEICREFFSESGSKTGESMLYKDGSGSVVYWDELGRIEDSQKFFPNGAVRSWAAYDYEGESEICSHQSYAEGDASGKTVYYSDIWYYSDGTVRESYSMDGIAETVRKYNSAGNLTQYTYTGSGSLLRQEDYIYNADGTVLLRENIQVWNPDGSVDFRETNEFYLSGGKSSHLYIYADGSSEYKEYDERGMWTLTRDADPSGVVKSIRERSSDGKNERVREYYADGSFKRIAEWSGGALTSSITYYENHQVHEKHIVNQDGTEDIWEYTEDGLLKWEHKATKDWVLDRNYTNGRRTYERYTEPSGKFISQTTWTYFTQGGEKKVRIDVTHGDGSTESKVVKDDGKIGYP